MDGRRMGRTFFFYTFGGVSKIRMKEGCEGEKDIEWRDIRPTSLMIIYFISEANFSHLMHIDNRSWKWHSAPDKVDRIYGRWAQNVLTNDGSCHQKARSHNNKQRTTSDKTT